MSNKENLIFALENAEDNQREIELRFVGQNATMMIRIVPELMVYGDSIEIYDEDFNLTIDFGLASDIDVDLPLEEYCVETEDGEFIFSFSPKG